MLNKSSDPSGFGQIFDMISNKDNAGLLDNLGGLIGGGNLAQGDPKDIGGSLMGSLFGDKVGGILDLVGSLSGVKRSSSSGLLGMVAPMIMGYLGKKVLGGGLGASGLIEMLTGQRKNITSAMPQGIADMIGFDLGDSLMDKASDALSGAVGGATGAVGGAADAAGKVVGTAGDTAKAAAGAVGGAAGKVVGTAGDTAKAAAGAVGDVAGKTADLAGGVAKSGGNMLMKILPLVGLLAVALIGWKMCGNEVPANPIDKVVDAAGDAASAVGDVAGDAASAVGDVAGDAAGAVGDMASDAAGAVGDAMGGLGDFFKTTLANGVELNIPEFGVENKLIKFLDNAKMAINPDEWYNFDRINFATGSATIDRDKSSEQINNIIEILKAYETVEIKIGGYTDNTGNPESNMRLSAARANAVKAALVAAGINGSRVTTEGYGIAHPVATNDTPEGRAQNRRIAVNVTKR